MRSIIPKKNWLSLRSCQGAFPLAVLRATNEVASEAYELKRPVLESEAGTRPLKPKKADCSFSH